MARYDLSDFEWRIIKPFRHIAMRFDRNPLNDLAMIKLASTRLWL
jgi:transposase